MTGGAGVRAIQMPPDIAGRRKVTLRVNRRANHRSNVAERQMPFVTKAVEQRRPWLSNAGLFVAAQADRQRRRLFSSTRVDDCTAEWHETQVSLRCSSCENGFGVCAELAAASKASAANLTCRYS